MNEIKSIIEEISGKSEGLFGKDFLLTWQKEKKDLGNILIIAEALKALRDNNISTKVFESGLAVSQFRDNFISQHLYR